MATLAAKSIASLQELRQNLECQRRTDLRNRFLMIDKYLQREGDYSKEGAALRAQIRNGRKDLGRNIEVPICFTKLESELAYQVGVFLTGFPIFGVVAAPKDQDAALQMQAMMGRDQAQFNWVGNLTKVLLDGLRYNLCAADAGWYREYFRQAGTKGQAIRYEGNAIKRVDPYNLIWDYSVKPNEVSKKGSFAAYIERVPYVECKKFLQALPDENKVLANIGDALKTAPNETLYYRPAIRMETSVVGGEDWSGFFGFESANGYSNEVGVYDIVTMYTRVIPKDHYIIAPMAGDPDVYKLIFVNSSLVYVERLDSEEFPLVICQPVDFGNGLEDKGFVENLLDLQDVATSLQVARSKSMRRAVTDRALYNPQFIDPRHLQNLAPEAQIPVKNGAMLKDMRAAYAPIPFNDTISPQYAQEFAMINKYADDVSGVNQAAQGNFVKGNRTLTEFDTVMSNARARSQVRAIQFENSLFTPVKEVLRGNYVQFSVAGTLYERQSKQVVSIDPAKLQEATLLFTLSDGLLPSSKIAGTDAMQQAIQLFQVVPQLAQQFDMAGMAVSMLKQMGFQYLDDFKLAAPAVPAGPAGNSNPPAPGAPQQ